MADITSEGDAPRAPEATLAEIRSLLDQSQVTPAARLANIRRVLDRSRPSPGEIYQKPWG